MKLSRKILVALLAALMCFSLVFAVGCNIIIVNPDDSSSSSSDSGSASDSGSSSSSKEEKTTIMSVAQNVDYKLYLENKDVKSNKKNEFFDKTSTLKVGDDNDFVVMPNVQFGMLEEGDPIPTPIPAVEWTYEISFTRITADGSVKVAADEVENYVEKIDNVNCAINFAEGAIGSTFEISVVPTGLTDKQKEEIVDYTATMTVEVVDGFNVYDAKELSVINNNYGATMEDNENSSWKTFKEANGIDVDYFPSNVILQKNISITIEDLATGLLIQKEDIKPGDADKDKALNSLRDWACVYYRNVAENETFTLEGNYFTLDASAIPLVVRPDNKVAENENFQSHAQLFFVDVANDKEETCFKNLNLIGNAPRVEDTNKSGGIIMAKVGYKGVHFYNNISNCWYINYFPNYSTGTKIEKCKAYDSFNVIVYSWGSNGTIIKDSELVGAGGPAIIADHVLPKAEDGGSPSEISVIDSEIHPYVAGTEGWFTQFAGATQAATLIKSMNAAFANPYFKRSFVYEKVGEEYKLTSVGDASKVYFLDFVALYKSGESAGLSADVITGKFAVKKGETANVPMDFGTYPDETANAEYRAMVALLLANTLGKTPAFQTSVGGLAYMGENGLLDLTDTQIADPANNIFKGDSLYIYYNGMGMCFGYGALAA